MIAQSIRNQNLIINKYKDILSRLSDERVMTVEYDSGYYFIYEKCDDWFCHKLTKEDCLELSNLFKEISEKIE